MKKITLLVTICMTLISLGSYAQGMGGGSMMGGGMGQRGGGMGQGGMGQGGAPQQQKREISVNFIGASGYIEIDSEEALQKIKVKKNPAKVEQIVTIINEYNVAFQSVVDEYRSDFDNLEFAKESIEAAEGNMVAMRDLMGKVSASMRIVKPLMVEEHKILTAKMTELLSDSEKELKGWEKFYAKLCKDNSFNPDGPERKKGEEGEDGPGEGGPGGQGGQGGPGGRR